MAFGRRGAAGPSETGRLQMQNETATEPDASGPRAELDDGETHVSAQWRAFALKATIGIALVAAFVGYNRFGNRLFSIADGGFYAGRPTQPYKVLEGAEPQAWKFGSCWLDSTQFLDGDDHNLIFNSLGRLHPETTPDALEAASQFFSCIARKEAKRLCDAEDRKSFVADIGTFYKRYDHTRKLATGEIRSPGVVPANAEFTMAGPFGDKIRAAQFNQRSRVIVKLEKLDDQVGRAIYTLIEGGVMTPTDFGPLKSDQVRHHLQGLMARPSTCE